MFKKKGSAKNKTFLSIKEASLPKINVYLEKIKEKWASIIKQYEEILASEMQPFDDINEKLDQLMHQLERKDLDVASTSLIDLVQSLASIIHHLDREHGESRFNPSRAIEPLVEQGNELLIKCGIAKLPYDHLGEITEKMIRREQLLADMQIELAANNNFKKLLCYIKDNYPNIYTVKKIFVSYAWPKKDKLHELWTKEFVNIFSRHLHEVGLIVYDDQHESGAGKVLQDFMDDRIAEVDHVLVISSRTMADKYQNDGFSGACNEYLKYIERFRAQRGERYIIPILLNKKNHSPGFVAKFAELSFYEEGYLNAFLDLIYKIYGVGEKNKRSLSDYVKLCNERPDKPLSEFLDYNKIIQSLHVNNIPAQLDSSIPEHSETQPNILSYTSESLRKPIFSATKKKHKKSHTENLAPTFHISHVSGNIAVINTNTGPVFPGNQKFVVAATASPAILAGRFDSPVFSHVRDKNPEMEKTEKNDKEDETENTLNQLCEQKVNPSYLS
jgi:hypothetical protein